MKQVKLITKYRFLDSEFAALKKLTGVSSEEEAELLLDKMEENTRDTLLMTMAFFTGNDGLIKNKVFNNSTGL